MLEKPLRCFCFVPSGLVTIEFLLLPGSSTWLLRRSLAESRGILGPSTALPSTLMGRGERLPGDLAVSQMPLFNWDITRLLGFLWWEWNQHLNSPILSQPMGSLTLRPHH